MDSEVRKKVEAWKKEAEKQSEEHLEEIEQEKKEEIKESEDFDKDNGSSYDNVDKGTLSDDSDTGCLSTIFSLVVVILGAALRLLWPIIKFIFLYYFIPVLAGETWLMFLASVFAPTGIIPLCIALAVASMLCFVAFWPYGIMVIGLKIKKQITTKEQLYFYGKWFLKGPFAYKDIKKFKEGLTKNNLQTFLL